MAKPKVSEQINVTLFWSPNTGKAGYQGPAYAVSSENALGKFDVLPEHTNFISLIFNKLSIVTLGKRKIDFQFKRGVLEVSDNNVKIFLGI